MQDWEEIPLGELCKVQSGSSNTQDAVEDGEYAFFDRSKKPKRSNRYLFDCEALIIAGEGAEFLPKRYNGRFDLHQRAYAIHGFGDKILADYLFYYLHHVHRYFQRVAVGATVKSLRQRHFDNLPIVVPPLTEQRRIVAILDEAFAGIATATANAEKNLTNARELVELETDQLLNASGADWTKTFLRDVCNRFEYGTSNKSRPEGEVPVLRMGNIRDREIDWANLVFTDNKEDIAKLSLRKNDVLFNRTNSLEHVGKAAIVRGDREAIFAGYLVRIHYDPALLSPRYLNFFLNSRRTREYGRSVAGKSVNQANISAGKLKDYPIHLPPISQQERIADRLDTFTAASVGLQSFYLRRLDDLRELRQAILAKVFSGGLTGVEQAAAA